MGVRRYDQFDFNVCFITFVCISVKDMGCKGERTVIIINMLGRAFKTRLVYSNLPDLARQEIDLEGRTNKQDR